MAEPNKSALLATAAAAALGLSAVPVTHANAQSGPAERANGITTNVSMEIRTEKSGVVSWRWPFTDTWYQLTPEAAAMYASSGQIIPTPDQLAARTQASQNPAAAQGAPLTQGVIQLTQSQLLGVSGAADALNSQVTAIGATMQPGDPFVIEYIPGSNDRDGRGILLSNLGAAYYLDEDGRLFEFTASNGLQQVTDPLILGYLRQAHSGAVERVGQVPEISANAECIDALIAAANRQVGTAAPRQAAEGSNSGGRAGVTDVAAPAPGSFAAEAARLDGLYKIVIADDNSTNNQCEPGTELRFNQATGLFQEVDATGNFKDGGVTLSADAGRSLVRFMSATSTSGTPDPSLVESMRNLDGRYQMEITPDQPAPAADAAAAAQPAGEQGAFDLAREAAAVQIPDASDAGADAIAALPATVQALQTNRTQNVSTFGKEAIGFTTFQQLARVAQDNNLNTADQTAARQLMAQSLAKLADTRATAEDRQQASAQLQASITALEGSVGVSQETATALADAKLDLAPTPVTTVAEEANANQSVPLFAGWDWNKPNTWVTPTIFENGGPVEWGRSILTALAGAFALLLASKLFGRLFGGGGRHRRQSQVPPVQLQGGQRATQPASAPAQAAPAQAAPAQAAPAQAPAAQAIQTAIAALEGRVNTLTKELEKQNLQIKSMEEQIAAFKDRAEKAELERDAALAKVAELQAQLAAKAEGAEKDGDQAGLEVQTTGELEKGQSGANTNQGEAADEDSNLARTEGDADESIVAPARPDVSVDLTEQANIVKGLTNESRQLEVELASQVEVDGKLKGSATKGAYGRATGKDTAEGWKVVKDTSEHYLALLRFELTPEQKEMYGIAAETDADAIIDAYFAQPEGRNEFADLKAAREEAIEYLARVADKIKAKSNIKGNDLSKARFSQGLKLATIVGQYATAEEKRVQAHTPRQDVPQVPGLAPA